MKKLFLNISVALVAILVPLAVPTAIAAAACPPPGSSQSQVLDGVGQTGSNCSGAGVTDTIQVVVTILSIIVGIAAIIMIIISGLKYITSSGDAGRIGSAKTTLVYALIGLAIAALAQVLVSAVLRATQ
ncbi:MAG: rane protein of unknown function [Candidatus Saccharibacteria bacterium]|nr:rane protein of unknown function [Candidatus Saccharibacteria bacterium]